MGNILIKNGRVIDPASGIDDVLDILIKNDKIKGIGKIHITKVETFIDAKNLLVLPGLVDMHTHLREQGQEDKETISTGLEAAIAGGFTSIACMANTNPPIDNAKLISFVSKRAKDVGFANMFPVGAVTKGLNGKKIAPLVAMAHSGAVAFSDDGKPIADIDVIKQALQVGKRINKVIIDHCSSLDNGLCEEELIARDIFLAEVVDAKIHIAHVSTREAVALIRCAKKRKIKITAEATPHHLTLYQTPANRYNPNYKMNPPLRSKADVDALVNGLRDGTIDVIASDHAPHTVEEKSQDWSKAPFGVIGLETTLPIVLTELVVNRKIGLKTAIMAMTATPAKILNIKKGSISVGSDADITIIDPKILWRVEPEKFKSKARNTPFAGKLVRGKAVKVIVRGKIFTNEI